MRARVDRGEPLYVKEWEAGYPEQNRRAQAWVAAHADALVS